MVSLSLDLVGEDVYQNVKKCVKSGTIGSTGTNLTLAILCPFANKCKINLADVLLCLRVILL